MSDAHPRLRLRDLGLPVRPWPRPEDGPIVYTHSARGAIFQLLRQLPSEKGDTVVVPAFHCPTLVEPVVAAGYRVVFYRIRRDLTIDEDDLASKLSPRIAAVIVIHYCGFPAALDAVLARRRTDDYVVIEDWAHSFLNGPPGTLAGGKGDASVFSFYKVVPCHVGGGLRLHTDQIRFRPSRRRVGLGESLVIWKRLAEEALENSGPRFVRSALGYLESQRVRLKRKLHSSRRAAEHRDFDAAGFRHDLAGSTMPWISRQILRASNAEAIWAIRRRHYGLLEQRIEESEQVRKVFARLPDGVCPWGFPLLLRDRSEHDHRMRAAGIPLFTFGEKQHPLLQREEGSLRDDAEFLSRSLLLMAVDQSLEEHALAAAGERLNEFLKVGVR